jgi:hypothetical protein
MFTQEFFFKEEDTQVVAEFYGAFLKVTDQ